MSTICQQYYQLALGLEHQTVGEHANQADWYIGTLSTKGALPIQQIGGGVYKLLANDLKK